MTSATSIHHAEQMALQLAGHSAAGEVSALWHRLVEERGWSDDRFAQMLGTMWVAALVR